jgi:hypothetical protein
MFRSHPGRRDEGLKRKALIEAPLGPVLKGEAAPFPCPLLSRRRPERLSGQARIRGAGRDLTGVLLEVVEPETRLFGKPCTWVYTTLAPEAQAGRNVSRTRSSGLTP